MKIKIQGDEHEVEEIAKVLINHATKMGYGIAVGKAHKGLGGFVKQVVITKGGKDE